MEDPGNTPWTWILQKDLELNVTNPAGYDCKKVNRRNSSSKDSASGLSSRTDVVNLNLITPQSEDEEIKNFINKDHCPPFLFPLNKENRDLKLPLIETKARIHVKGHSLYEALQKLTQLFEGSCKEDGMVPFYRPTVDISLKDFLLSQLADTQGFICYDSPEAMVEFLMQSVTWNAYSMTCSFLCTTVVEWRSFLVKRLKKVMPFIWCPVNMGPLYNEALNWYKNQRKNTADILDTKKIEHIYALYVLHKNVD